MTNQHIPNGQLDAIDHALHAISNADALLVGAGAGTVIPTVREQCEAIASERDAPHIRVNPAEADHSAHTITLKMGACAGLTLLDKLLRTRARG